MTAAEMAKSEEVRAETAEDVAVEGLRASEANDTANYSTDAIRVDFYGCTRIDKNDVVCAFDLTAAGYDWEFGGCYAGHPEAIDDAGREVMATYTTVANDLKLVPGGGCPRKTLVEGITTEGRIRFNGVHSGATSFALLTWKIDAHTTQVDPPPEELMFRDIPLD